MSRAERIQEIVDAIGLLKYAWMLAPKARQQIAEVALDAADATRGQVTAVGMGEMFRIINGALMGDTAKVRNYTDKTQLGREEVLYGPPPAPPAPLPRPTLRFSQTSLRTRATRSTPSGSEPY